MNGFRTGRGKPIIQGGVTKSMNKLHSINELLLSSTQGKMLKFSYLKVFDCVVRSWLIWPSFLLSAFLLLSVLLLLLVLLLLSTFLLSTLLIPLFLLSALLLIPPILLSPLLL
ncbi:hypothetical protein HYDPIDRAFT_34689 [Hydnomerulius pinastri MD-312]|uniref:Uncharacterized protein n=1 Tax=Hydnomerulius pinastri MD-312 TaxID=994086 RepID=A0A0C9UXY6_9AGAM|nr:hypothetical protein HYDPIDRAFT_34689 [Hydnomerulius pinastri MD-312]